MQSTVYRVEKILACGDPVSEKPVKVSQVLPLRHRKQSAAEAKHLSANIFHVRYMKAVGKIGRVLDKAFLQRSGVVDFAIAADSQAVRALEGRVPLDCLLPPKMLRQG